MEKRSRRPDPPPVCHAAVRAAVAEAARRVPKLALFAGGRSFGGRMTSQAQAIEPLSGVEGLAFIGFPLHPAGKPSTERAEHLRDVSIPMLFLQGTRDELANLKLLRPLIKRLGTRATLKLLKDADHSFHVPARTGRKDPDVRAEMLDLLAAWIEQEAHTPRATPHPARRGTVICSAPVLALRHSSQSRSVASNRTQTSRSARSVRIRHAIHTQLPNDTTRHTAL
jgi:predicted alpha/beta-hydrolase family hydrolase